MRRGFVLAGAAAVVLAACGASDEEAGGTTERSEGAPGAGAPAREAARRGVRLVGIGRFDSPLYITQAPGERSRLHVVEQAGRIRVLRGGRKLRRPFLDIRSQVTSGGEQGMLGLAFAPDHRESRRFYVYFTRRDGRQTLVEYRYRTLERADHGSARVVFVHDDEEGNHNGGSLVFGPDGLLYVGTGDGGGGNDQHGPRGNAQNLGSPLGKLLRIDPRAAGGQPFRVPSSNPFVGRAGARPEIYSYGLRNPWRFSFDRRTGDLVIGDVGQNAVEEIDFVRRGRGKGANFGWRPFEGRTRIYDEDAPGHIPPVITHTHDDGWCSITGGYIVRDPAVPSLYGRYVYGDFCLGRLYSARLRSGRATAVRPVPGVRQVESLSSFGEDTRGRVYAVSLAGPVYRLASGR